MATPATGREWEFTVPPGTLLLTLNQRWGHWGAVHSRTQNLEAIAGWAVVASHIPTMERARITYTVVAPDRKRRDPGNWMPTAKALVDGLVKQGMIKDDDFSRVEGPHPAFEVQKGCKLHVRLKVTELTGEYIP